MSLQLQVFESSKDSFVVVLQHHRIRRPVFFRLAD